MRVLVGCEFSGRVRDAFRDKGHEAWSCDLLGPDQLPEEFKGQKYPNYHLEGDVRQFLNNSWDMLIAFPPCTHLALSGARWFHTKQREQKEALQFVLDLFNSPIKKLCIENPMSIISSRIEPPTQIIQPWMFGHPEVKTTCLWLDELPLLKSTNVVSGREQRVHYEPPSPTRWLERSRTYEGIAKAMAEQWG